MALDLQQRPARPGHRWHRTRNETENSRVILQADPIKNEGLPGNRTYIITASRMTSGLVLK